MYCSRLSENDSHTVPAEMVEPSFSFTSTPPGNSAGFLGRPAGFERFPPSFPSSQYASYCASAGSANLDGSGSHASAMMGLYGCSIHVPVVGILCFSPSHWQASESQYVGLLLFSSQQMKRW